LGCITSRPTPPGGQHADKAPFHRRASRGAARTHRDRGSARRARSGRVPATPPRDRQRRAGKRSHLSTAKTSLGRILVNSSGHTLYLFGKDKNGKSSCSGMCASFWPPLITTGKPRAGTGAKASLLGTTKRADGRLQVTYNHHPLYMFKKDTKKGQTNGEGLSAFGATWYAVSPAGARVVKSGGGGGY
jgi:predicted lipoprotein with Yx(FWY)xxD motif